MTPIKLFTILPVTLIAAGLATFPVQAKIAPDAAKKPVTQTTLTIDADKVPVISKTTTSLKVPLLQQAAK